MATGGIRMLKFIVLKSVVEIKTSSLGHWKAKRCLPIKSNRFFLSQLLLAAVK